MIFPQIRGNEVSSSLVVMISSFQRFPHLLSIIVLSFIMACISSSSIVGLSCTSHRQSLMLSAWVEAHSIADLVPGLIEELSVLPSQILEMIVDIRVVIYSLFDYFPALSIHHSFVACFFQSSSSVLVHLLSLTNLNQPSLTLFPSFEHPAMAEL